MNGDDLNKMIPAALVGCLCWVIIIACIGLVIHFA